MALNIKNVEVEALAAEIAELTGESKTEAIRQALLERKRRLSLRVERTDRVGRLRRFLEREVWPNVPAAALAHGTSKAEVERILGMDDPL
jgi:antitoxin VapB